MNAQQATSAPSLQINESSGAREIYRKQESDPNENGYVLNCIHESRPLTLNGVCEPLLRGGSMHTRDQ